MLKTKLVALTAASVAALAVAPSAHAATSYFMRLDPAAGDQQIQGESVDKTYKGWIELKSFDWGVENPTTIGSMSGGAGAGKAKFDELTVEKAVDSTTPQLLERLAQGRHFAGVEIDARKTGPTAASASKPIRYYFSTAFLASQTQSGDAGDDAPQEKLTFVYGGVGQRVTRQTPTGAPGNTVFGNWSVMTNSPLTSDKLPTDWTTQP